jgi:phage repressor protein C with HTH and peptisase S24 domain
MVQKDNEIKRFAGRLREAIASYNSTSEAARRTGCSESALRKWLDGKSEPTRKNLVSLAEATGVNVEWLATGTGPKYREGRPAAVEHLPIGRQGGGDYPVSSPGYHPRPGDYVYVPRYDIQLAAGGGAVTGSEQVVDYLAFQASWVKNRLGLSPQHLALVEVVGDSMAPTLSNGDLALIDTRIDRLKDDAIYALAVAGDLIVKRLQRHLDGSVQISSDNPAYPPEILTPGAAEQLRVIGRVVWIGRQL